MRHDFLSHKDGNDNNKNQDIQKKESTPLQAGKNITEGTSDVPLQNTPGTGMEAFNRALSRYKSGETHPPSTTPIEFLPKEDPLTSEVMEEMIYKLSFGQGTQEVNSTGTTKQLDIKQLTKIGEPLYEAFDKTTDLLLNKIKDLSINEIPGPHTNTYDQNQQAEIYEAAKETLLKKYRIHHNRFFKILDQNMNEQTYTVAQLLKSGYTTQDIIDLDQQAKNHTDPQAKIYEAAKETLRKEYGIHHNRFFKILDQNMNEQTYTVAQLLKSGYTTQDIIDLDQQAKIYEAAKETLRKEYEIHYNKRLEILDQNMNKQTYTVAQLLKSGYTTQDIIDLDQQEQNYLDQQEQNYKAAKETLYKEYGMYHNKRLEILDQNMNKQTYTVAQLLYSGYTIQDIVDLDQNH